MRLEKYLKEETKFNVKTAKGRIEWLKANAKNPKVKEWIEKLYTTTSIGDIQRMNHWKDIGKEDIGGLIPGTDESISSTLYDMKNQRESEVRRAEKDAAKAVLQAKRDAKAAEKQSVADTITKYLKNPALKKALEGVGEEFWKEIYESAIQYFHTIIGHNFTDDMFNTPRPDFKDYRAREIYDRKRNESAPFIATGGKLRPDAYDVAEKMSKENADLVVTRWVNKMAIKIGVVIERKGGAEVKKVGGMYNHAVYLKFEDGSRFIIATQQVISRSKLGTVFARYPSTFHEVYDHNGVKMVSPSAEKMEKVFGLDSTVIKAGEE